MMHAELYSMLAKMSKSNLWIAEGERKEFYESQYNSLKGDCSEVGAGLFSWVAVIG